MEGPCSSCCLLLWEAPGEMEGVGHCRLVDVVTVNLEMLAGLGIPFQL